jgi:DNA-binding winged helix-turn-helix (wHTH) protein
VRRRLTRDGEPMKLPAKQLETLLYFVENAGRVIEKDELFAAIWPGRMVEESSLTQTIFLLRRALQEGDAERYIRHVQSMFGDGFAFTYAGIYAQWGEPETALHWLEVAFAHPTPTLCNMRPYGALHGDRAKTGFSAAGAMSHLQVTAN